jgi:hypothetical protein
MFVSRIPDRINERANHIRSPRDPSGVSPLAQQRGHTEMAVDAQGRKIVRKLATKSFIGAMVDL